MREKSLASSESALLGEIGEGALLWATRAEKMSLSLSQFAFQIEAKVVE